MQRQGTSEEYSSSEVLRLAGIITVIMSVVVGLVAMFAFPAGCSALAGMVLLFAGVFFIIGLTTFFISLVMSRRQT